MELKIESANLKDYLKEIPPIVQFNTPLVKKTIAEIKAKSSDPKEQAKIAFEMARDEIKHSFDDPSRTCVTINAEEILEKKEGICFAKAHLLATLVRGLGIPCGFCYQRVMRDGKTPESGYALHGLNAIYFEDTGWFRVDPRGNKPGIDSEFTIDHEQLAYTIHTDLGEVDYPNVYPEPLRPVVRAMLESANSKELFTKRPPAIV